MRTPPSIRSTTSALICSGVPGTPASSGEKRRPLRRRHAHHRPLHLVVVPPAALADVAFAHGVPDLLRLEQDAVQSKTTASIIGTHCNFGRVSAISTTMADDRERFERIYRENFRAVLRFAATADRSGAGEGRRGGDLPRRVAAARRRSGRAAGVAPRRGSQGDRGPVPEPDEAGRARDSPRRQNAAGSDDLARDGRRTRRGARRVRGAARA